MMQQLKNTLVLTLILLTVSLLFFACRKNDFSIHPNNEDATIARFFRLPVSAPPAVARIAQKLQNLHQQTGFVNTLIAQEGFAIWDKAIINTQPQGNARNFNNHTDTIVYIPLVVDSANSVGAFIYATLNGTMQLRLYRGREYANYGFGNIADSTENAERLALQIMMLNNSVFGYNRFGLTDSRLFSNFTTPGTDTAHMERYLDLGSADNATNRNGGHWETGTVTICTRPNFEPLEPANQRAFNATSLRSSVAVNRWNCVTTVRYYFVSDDDEPVGNIVIYNEGGGGGNGTIHTNGPVPCNPTPLLDNGLLPCEEGNLTGWTIRDAHGFLYTRIAQLDSLLAQNRFALLPCDSTILMPFMSYGPMYQKVAQHPVPQAVLNRLDSLTTYGPTFFSASDYFNIQSLNDASGAEVNCDFFPIKIDQMPLKPNGTSFTPKELVEYFRLHKNDFISPSIGIFFEPYYNIGFNDSIRFNAPYEQSIGAILHIHMTKDGSIVHTGYTNRIDPGTNYQEHSFIYTTLYTGLDIAHPVSGNREFGIYSDQNNPGSYVFYTMGVDRITNSLYQVMDEVISYTTGSDGFDKADELWTDIQENMINFINSRGGQASFYTRKNTIARPKWSDVSDFLKGLISIEQLKQRLGC